jgi:hypothetical protein
MLALTGACTTSNHLTHAWLGARILFLFFLVRLVRDLNECFRGALRCCLLATLAARRSADGIEELVIVEIRVELGSVGDIG